MLLGKTTKTKLLKKPYLVNFKIVDSALIVRTLYTYNYNIMSRVKNENFVKIADFDDSTIFDQQTV